MTPERKVTEKLAVTASEAARRSSGYLMSLQHPDGYWWGELTADTTLESDFILLQLWLYPPRGAYGILPRGDSLTRQCVRYWRVSCLMAASTFTQKGRRM